MLLVRYFAAGGVVRLLMTGLFGVDLVFLMPPRTGLGAMDLFCSPMGNIGLWAIASQDLDMDLESAQDSPACLSNNSARVGGTCIEKRAIGGSGPGPWRPLIGFRL